MKERDMNGRDEEAFLAYKEHSEFFEEFFILRKNFNRDLALSLFDTNLLRGCYVNLTQLLEWANSQTAVVNKNSADYDKELKEIMVLFKQEKYSEIRGKLKYLFRALSLDHQKAELTPKVKIEEKDDELSSLDDKTRAALEAWKLVYAQ